MLEGYESNMEITDSVPKAPVETPEATPKVETPAEETPSEESPKIEEPETPEVPTEEAPEAEDNLFELPDGRKVDLTTAQREWKDNFLPEFTRKSQKLAEYEKNNGFNNPPEVKKEEDWKDPDYVPRSYAEIVEIAKMEAINEIRGQAKAEEDRVNSVKSAIDNEIGEIKKIDPKLDENALFVHANKYGFGDLKSAYQNMKDMKMAIVSTEQKVLKSVKTREADPVSDAASPGSTDTNVDEPFNLSQFGDASEALAFIKAKK